MVPDITFVPFEDRDRVPGMNVGTFSSNHPFEKQYMSFCEPVTGSLFFASTLVSQSIIDVLL